MKKRKLETSFAVSSTKTNSISDVNTDQSAQEISKSLHHDPGHSKTASTSQPERIQSLVQLQHAVNYA